MGYTTANGRWANTIPITLASGVIAATTTSASFELGDRVQMRLNLTVSAAAGTSPTLDVALSTSPDAVTWTAVASFTQATAAGTSHKVFTGLDRFVRVVETIGGTGSPTFTRVISGEAV